MLSKNGIALPARNGQGKDGRVEKRSIEQGNFEEI